MSLKVSWMMLISAIFAGPIATGCGMAATPFCGLTTVSVLVSLAPILTAFIGKFVLHEHLSGRVYIGIIITAAGVIMNSWSGFSESGSNFLLGVVLALMAPIGFTVENQLSTYAGDMIDPNVGCATFRCSGSFVIGTLTMILFSAVTGNLDAFFSIVGLMFTDPKCLVLFIIMGLLGAINYNAAYLAFNLTGPSRVMTIDASKAVLSIPVGFLCANSGFLDPEKKLEDYSAQEWQDFLHGSGRIVDIHNTTGRVWGDYQLTYEGFLDRITRLYLKRDANALSKSGQRILRDFTERCVCPMCHGARLNAVALGSRLAGRNIAEMGELEVSELIPVLKTITNPVGVPLVCKIVRVLEGIENMGLGYLSLNRSSVTLSGGEAQRLRMVRHLGSSLTGLTYIFDEPTSGLHPKDAARLSDLLLRLRDRGNTVLVVEHNRQIIRIADQVIDLGPGAGRNGGQVLFQGTPGALLHADTPTAHSLRRRDRLNRAPRTLSGWLEIAHARLHNLKDVSVRIPQGVLTVVSGLAGSGKSSLACGELLRQHPDAVHISQAPIGTTSRSNPATYIGVMDEIRRLFARANGVEAARFSYNSKGACPACEGRGVIKTEMAFMDPVTIPCEACQGSRYSASTLRYLYQGKNILEVLSMTVDEAMEFFDTPKVWEKLRVLRAVGMGYLTLGQPTSTLSGGECQRMKLASHLNGQNGLYILDEPAVGLHGQDVARLLEVLDDLTRRGNTIVVIEHHLDVIAHADWVIDMGPEGGKRGGQVLFSGTPEQLLSVEHSATAEYLRDALRDVW